MVIISSRTSSSAKENEGSTSEARILVLDNSDSDFRAPPFEDNIIVFEANGKSLYRIADFNICQTVGGHRAISIAPGQTVSIGMPY